MCCWFYLASKSWQISKIAKCKLDWSSVCHVQGNHRHMFLRLLSTMIYSTSFTFVELTCFDKKFSPFFQYLLRRASLTESDGFAFLRADKEDCITYSGFCEALRQVCCSVHRWIISLKFRVMLVFVWEIQLVYKDFFPTLCSSIWLAIVMGWVRKR